MAKSKKRNVKVRDLKPKKDAKGGIILQNPSQQGGFSSSGGGLSNTGGGFSNTGGGLSNTGGGKANN
jgi:hypothetical protein